MSKHFIEVEANKEIDIDFYCRCKNSQTFMFAGATLKFKPANELVNQRGVLLKAAEKMLNDIKNFNDLDDAVSTLYQAVAKAKGTA